jgi:hypothetical protein
MMKEKLKKLKSNLSVLVFQRLIRSAPCFALGDLSGFAIISLVPRVQFSVFGSVYPSRHDPERPHRRHDGTGHRQQPNARRGLPNTILRLQRIT